MIFSLLLHSLVTGWALFMIFSVITAINRLRDKEAEG